MASPEQKYAQYINKKTGLVPMQFRHPAKDEPVRRYKNINPGEIAGVVPEDVETLLKSGWAEIHEAKAEAKK
jgi:hypothetical protein